MLSLSLSFANTRSTQPWPLSTEHRRAAVTAHLCSSSSYPRVHLNMLSLLEEQDHKSDNYTESNSRITPASSPTSNSGFTAKFVTYICSTGELYFPVLLDVKVLHAGHLHAAVKLLEQRVHLLVHCSELKTSPNIVFPRPLAADYFPEVVSAAVEGTKNVINVAADMGVKRVVFTSSYGAVHMDPNRSPDQTLDESCWSDPEFCKQTKELYCYAKTIAEKMAMEEASKRGIQLVGVVPSLTIGEMLQPTFNLSALAVSAYMKGKKVYPNAVAAYVDVQDVACAHLLVYENPIASGRYLCIGDVLHRSEFLQMMRELFPQYPITTKCEDDKPKVKPYKFSTQRLQALGMKFTPFRESIRKTVISLQVNGHIPILPPMSTL